MMLIIRVFYACAWISKDFYSKFNDNYWDVKVREVLNEIRSMIKKLFALIEAHKLINVETSWKAKAVIHHFTFSDYSIIEAFLLSLSIDASTTSKHFNFLCNLM
jgi:hypothetical protein